MTATRPDILASPARPRRRGFTLAEMLVIVGIILLVMAIALPAFTVIVSSRSVESARNIVASSLVRARGEAIRRGQPCGVFFYVDPDTGRSGLALVTLDPLVDLDPYKEYQPFTRGDSANNVDRDYQGGTLNPLTDELNEPAMTADRVVVLAQDGDPAGPADDPSTPAIENTYGPGYESFNGRPIVIVHEKTREPPALTDPGDTTTEPDRFGTSRDAITYQDLNNPNPPFWGEEGVGGLGTLELISGIDPILLPSGAAVQVILGDTLQSSAASPAGDGPADDNGFKYAVPGDGAPAPTDPDFPEFIERYARAGLIVFDEEGHLVQADYRIDRDSKLGRTIGLEAVVIGGSVRSEYLMTAPLRPAVLGVVIYERDGFESAAADGTALVWKGGLITTLAEPTSPFADYFRTTQGDVRFPYPPQDRPTAAMTEPVPAGTDWRFHEYAEERWLDANTIPLMVNRYSGTLTEAE